MAPAFCSMKCPTRDATKSTHALTSAAALTSPTATLIDVTMLAATAASDGILDSDTICGATSTPTSRDMNQSTSIKPRPIPWPSFADLPGDVLQLLGNLSSSASCLIAKDQCTARPKSCFNALFLRINESALDIQCEQHVCVTSYALLWHERHTTVILLRVPVNGSVLSLVLSGSPHNFPVADLLESGIQLKCTRRAQGLTGELRVEATASQNTGACCLWGTLYQASCNKPMSQAKLPDAIRGLLIKHHSRLGFVILGVLVTWPQFSMDKSNDLSSTKISFQVDPVSSADKLRYMAIYLVHISFSLAALTIWPCIPVLSLGNILGEWYLGNQSIIARVCPDYSLKKYLLADNWRSRSLCVGLVCAVFIAVVLPEHHLMEFLQFGQFPGGTRELTSTNACWSAISIHVTEIQGAYVSAQLQWCIIASVLSCELIHVGKRCLNLKSAHQLSILAPTMFSFGWGNLDNNAEQWPPPELEVLCSFVIPVLEVQRCSVRVCVMVWDTIDDQCNSEGNSEHHDSVLTHSHETVLISMWEHQLSMFLLNCHVQISTGSVKSSIYVLPNEFLLQWYVASSALSLDHLFECELCVTVRIVLAVFTSQEATPGIKMQAPRNPWYFSMQRKMIWDPSIGFTPSAYTQLVTFSFTYACRWQLFEHSFTSQYILDICCRMFLITPHITHWKYAAIFTWLDERFGLGLYKWYQSARIIDSRLAGDTVLYVSWSPEYFLLAYIGCTTMNWAQEGFQGGRCVIISLAQYSYIEFLDYQDSNGLKVLQVLWYTSLSNAALGAKFKEIALHILWDPGVRNAAHYAHAFLVLRLERGELIQWLAANLLGAYQIWLVAWAVGSLKFSIGCGQAPFQGGRDAIRAACSDQVHFSHDYYVNQAYCNDIVCSDIIYYREDYQGDSNKTKEVHMPWDPGIVSPLISCEASAWGQAEFQGGRDVRTLPCTHLTRLVPWAPNDGLGPAQSLLRMVTYKYPRGGNGNGIRLDQETARRLSLSPTSALTS